ncbi:MAG TPA: tetratricopeptide repeat protein, partial [Micromonosporaceae bacterium]|nr:tetratricopeptide repeat protein [Micromonosporaceae bacterium]
LASAVALATDLAYNREHNAARALGERTFEAYREVRGDDHPETWVCAINLAHDRRAAGDAAAAAELQAEATAALARLLDPKHPDVRAGEAGERLECDIEPPQV